MAVYGGVARDDQPQLEAIAADIRRRARVRRNELPPLASTMALAALGSSGLVFGHPHVLPHYDPEGDCIVVPERYPDLNFAIAHELAEVAFHRWTPMTFPTHRDKERAANYVAAALLAPPRLVCAHVPTRDIAALARMFKVSQSTMVLRIAEVLRCPRAIVTRKDNVHTRDIDADPVQLVGFARVSDSSYPGLIKTPLTGRHDTGRVAIIAS